jgi:hypothetical protein
MIIDSTTPKLFIQLPKNRFLLEVLPTDLYAKLIGIKPESLKRMRIAGTGKHKFIKLAKHYFYITGIHETRTSTVTS